MRIILLRSDFSIAHFIIVYLRSKPIAFASLLSFAPGAYLLYANCQAASGPAFSGNRYRLS
jgi:hypothetical protein